MEGRRGEGRGGAAAGSTGRRWATAGPGCRRTSTSRPTSRAPAGRASSGRSPSERYEFLILDEITYPLKWGWIDVEEFVATLRDRPGFQHIVVTGRDAPPELIAAADLVTEVTKVKHPMDEGIRAQQGIEW